MRSEGFGAAEEVAKFCVDVRISFRSAGFRPSLDCVVATLNGREVDIDVRGRRRSYCWVGFVNED